MQKKNQILLILWSLLLLTNMGLSIWALGKLLKCW